MYVVAERAFDLAGYILPYRKTAPDLLIPIAQKYVSKNKLSADAALDFLGDAAVYFPSLKTVAYNSANAYLTKGYDGPKSQVANGIAIEILKELVGCTELPKEVGECMRSESGAFSFSSYPVFKPGS